MQSRQFVRSVFRLLLSFALGGFGAGLAHGQSSNVFTLQMGTAVAPPATLVSHSNLWSYHRGTNEPQANWQTLADAALDATWASGPGGFGYGDPAITGELTTLTGMSNVFSTFYIRRSFTAGSVADTNLHLRLTVDYDDGFVAYLDGVEVARRNLTNGVGTFVAHGNTTITSHEASCCDAPTHPAEVIDLGSVSNRLAAGNHVLAVIGVNGTLASSDFHIIVDLALDGSSSSGVNGPLLAVVTTNSIQLSGTNTMTGSARVMVNGDEATFNPALGTWSRTQLLKPGVNHLNIQAVDATGQILAATNRLVVAELGTVSIGGTLGATTVWSASNGVVRLTNTVVVPPGGSLTIQEGVVVLANANCSIQATNSSLTATGTTDRVIYFLPADGVTTNWGELVALGTNGQLSLRHVETLAGHVELINGAVGLLEDSYFHDYQTSDPAIIHTLGVPNPATITVRRCHVSRYHEILCQVSTNFLEGMLCEYQDYSGDGIDFDAGQRGSHIQRCTVRRGLIFNTDALDMGEYSGTGEQSRGVLIDSCLLHDFIDKGVSMGVQVDITVTNCVIYNVDGGIAVKDLSTAGIYNTTIADANYGYHCYNKANSGSSTGGGLITNSFNNVLWHFGIATLSLLNGSSLVANYCDFDGTNWPGTGHINADPLFVDSARHNYRLGAGSPALGTGLNGANMGATYPVGGIPATPLNVAALTLGLNQIQLAWTDDADNEDGVEVQRSTDALVWQTIGAAAPDATNFTDATIAMDQHYYYRVRTTNYIGVSDYSGIVGAIQRTPVTFVGGVLASNTIWSPALGTIYVISSVTVPTNLTLTIAAGTVVKLTNNAMLTASTGGVIRIQGTWDQRVVLQRWNGTNNWGELRAEGTNSFLEVHFADISGAQTTIYYDATALLEDTYFHDFHQQAATTIFNQPLILTHYAGPCSVRRCHMNQYYETLWRHGINTIEDNVFENMNGDALDFDTGQPGSVIRRCTFAHGNVFNVDAVDIGNDGAIGTHDAIIENCHMYDFPFDKGVSIGENSLNITVRNCLMNHVSKGVQVKDVCTANIYNCTITDAEIGIHGFEKTAGTGAGQVTNSYNNLLWGLSSNAIVYDPVKSVMVVNYTDTQGTNWPSGTGNINVDPLFLNPAAWDWRIPSNSPCVGAGKDGANLGITYPVGVFITAPSGLAAAGGSNSIALSWQDNSPSEAVFLIERASDGGLFTNLTHVPLNTTNYMDADVLVGHNYAYRVRGASINTNSEYSLEASASVGLPPVITAQPASLVVAPGANVAFTVAAYGTGTLTFAWQHNGILLYGLVSPTLNLTNVQATNSGDFVVIVSDALGSATSAVARLTVTAPPQVGLGESGSGMNSNHQFSLQFSAPSNITVVIEASTNLHDWLPVQTNNSGDGSIQFTDPATTNFWDRFYRALLRP